LRAGGITRNFAALRANYGFVVAERFQSGRHAVHHHLDQLLAPDLDALDLVPGRAGAAEALRGLIDATVLTPQETELKVELQGNPTAMLKAEQATTGASLAPLGRWGDERSPDDDDLVQIMLVAGA